MQLVDSLREELTSVCGLRGWQIWGLQSLELTTVSRDVSLTIQIVKSRTQSETEINTSILQFSMGVGVRMDTVLKK